MTIAARIQPILGLLLIGGALVALRLYQVQVHEHDVWAEEAARLVHSGREVPYRRGPILDTEGRVLARDKDTFHLVLVYRDFRRGHPLGQVAHARSLIEGRAVSLDETRARIHEWADELCRLTPRELLSFGRGEGLVLPSLTIPALPEPGRRAAARAAALPRRAKDVGFYVRRLFDLEEAEVRRLEKLAREEVESEDGIAATFVELAARASERALAPDELRHRAGARLDRALGRLGRMAELLEWSEEDLERASPVDLLIADIEDTRRWVEDATAAKLFAEAAGFVPGRVAADTLVTRVDLDWIARELAWDQARLYEWARTARAGWKSSWRDGYALPRLIADLRLDPANPPAPGDYLSAVLALFRPEGAVEAALTGQPPAWDDPRATGALAVLANLDDLFEARAPREKVHTPVLPIESSAFKAAYAVRAERWESDRAALEQRFAEAARLRDEARRAERLKLLGREADDRRADFWRVIDVAWSLDGSSGSRMTSQDEESFGAQLGALFASSSWSAADEAVQLTGSLVEEWDVGLQRAIRARLDALAENADADELDGGRLVVAREHKERAAERAEFFLKDYGRRLKPLMREEPGYEVLSLIARYGADFAGFQAREAREREYPVLEGDEVRLAPDLVGNVSSIGVADLVAQRREASQLRALKRIPEKSEEERHELEALVGRVLLSGEVKGVQGVEGYWNPELTGRNGYYETTGLEDVYGAGRDSTEYARPVDGEAVVLTLDTDLQRAAQRVLRSGAGLEDPLCDTGWYREPVGAAVLVSIDGDVLAAASEPDLESEIFDDDRPQRQLVIDRTLRIPSFQPPGSVFKPFVAAYALSEVPRISVHDRVDCSALPDGHAGYVDVHCHSYWGHAGVEMERAIVVSCNAYFAWLGESLTEAELRAAARTFGFESGYAADSGATGIQTPPPGNLGLMRRQRLLEESGGMRAEYWGPLHEHDRRLAGNGLGVVQATPLQIARGTLALATGELVDLRLVRRIGEEDLPQAARQPLELKRSALEFVRNAMVEVVSSRDPNRTGKVLGTVGVSIAAKTGSADLATGTRRFHEREVVPKNTWVMGWAPAEDPVVAFVVFVHDTLATSSHGAVYLARELMVQPEVLAYLAEHGADVSEVGAR